MTCTCQGQEEPNTRDRLGVRTQSSVVKAAAESIYARFGRKNDLHDRVQDVASILVAGSSV